jgi:phage terminase large subunit
MRTLALMEKLRESPSRLSTINAGFPKKLKALSEPKRYKILYGGRGGAKSWGIARALLIKGTERPLRILCAREIQKSIGDSVLQLLNDQIQALGLTTFYQVQKTSIVGVNGTSLGFEGLKHNVHSLKSYEGADICWVEEAVTVSKSSWEILIPTIRKEGSEIWISFNPELEEDETYQRFVVNPPKESIVIKLNWRDNPWFPEVLKQEMNELKERSEADYLNIWEGEPRSAVEGSIYEHELRQATEKGRITTVPYDQSKPVNTYWDLGHSDQTAIWFIQQMGFEYRVLEYYSNSHQNLKHYLDVLQSKDYTYGTHYLPHDARAQQLAADKTVEQQVRDVLKNVIVVRQGRIQDGIQQTRLIFPHCWFDKEKCADGLSALRRYAYDKDMETGRISVNPKHDIWSHGADALRTFSMSPKTYEEYDEDRQSAQEEENSLDPY